MLTAISENYWLVIVTMHKSKCYQISLRSLPAEDKSSQDNLLEQMKIIELGIEKLEEFITRMKIYVYECLFKLTSKLENVEHKLEVLESIISV
ncbi:hypothetical protein GJ496_004676 [Pomphorhynchus laevis]|nr:hypothetical protein GJ496_004676 [Pomphorhynchus laevis]